MYVILSDFYMICFRKAKKKEKERKKSIRKIE